MKTWKCTVCGYLHHGENPPERCPICNAPKEKFIEVILENHTETANPDTEADLQTDVIVIGSGAAAFAAAITACSKGSRVVMLEKAAEIGGTTARSGGGMWIPNNQFQKEAGIK